MGSFDSASVCKCLGILVCARMFVCRFVVMLVCALICMHVGAWECLFVPERVCGCWLLTGANPSGKCLFSRRANVTCVLTFCFC